MAITANFYHALDFIASKREEVSRRVLREKEEAITSRNRELEETIRLNSKKEHEIWQGVAILDVSSWPRSPLVVTAEAWAVRRCSGVLTAAHRCHKPPLVAVPTTYSMALNPPRTLILNFVAQY